MEPESNKTIIYNERTAVDPLTRGQTVLVRGMGNSMTPILKSGEVVQVVPIKPDTSIVKGDVVVAKVIGNVYLHKVTAIRNTKTGKIYQIGNNHGYKNGWTHKIIGKAIL